MAAKKGNKYAEKWNKVTTLKALNQIFQDVKDNKLVYLGVALANIGLYGSIWTDWLAKFGKDREVSETIKRIEGQIESHLLDQALHNKVNSKVAIFVLQNKYKWSDKKEIDHTSKGESMAPVINIIKPNA